MRELFVGLLLALSLASTSPAVDLADSKTLCLAIQNIETAQEAADQWDLLLEALTIREPVYGMGPVPTTPSAEAQKIIIAHMPTLESELLSPEAQEPEERQMRVLELLGSGKTEQSLDLLLNRIPSSSSRLRRASLRSLLERSKEVALLLKRDPERLAPLTQSEPVRLLGNLAVPETLPLLFSLFQEGSESLHVVGKWALCQFGPDGAEAMRAAFHPAGPALQLALIEAIGAIADEDSLAFVASLLKKAETSPALLIQIADTAPCVSEPDFRRELLAHLFHSEVDVRLAVIRALGRSQDPLMAYPIAVSMLSGILQLEDAVRPALQALGSDAAFLFPPLLRSADFNLQHMASLALLSMGPIAEDALLQAFQDPEQGPEQRAVLARLLCRQEDFSTEATLEKKIRILAGYPPLHDPTREGWLSPFRTLLQDPSPTIRLAVVQELSQYEDPEVYETLLETLLRDPAPLVVKSAGRALETQLYKFRDTLRSEISRSGIQRSRRLADALLEMGYNPHRLEEKLDLWIALERWSAVNRLGPDICAPMIKAWIESPNAADTLKRTHALSLLDPTPFRGQDWATLLNEDIIDFMPWQNAFTRAQALYSILDMPEDLQPSLLSLAVHAQDPILQESLRDAITKMKTLPVGLFVAMIQSESPPLPQKALDLLADLSLSELAPLAATMLQVNRNTATAIAELLYAKDYEPPPGPLGLRYALLLNDWEALARQGDAGLALLEKQRPYQHPRDQLDMLLILHASRQSSPLQDLLALGLRAPAQYARILDVIRRAGLPMQEELQSALLESGFEKTRLTATLLKDLDWKPEEDQTVVCMDSAAGRFRILSLPPQQYIRFYLNDMMSGDPDRTLRGAIWMLLFSAAQPESEGAPMTVSSPAAFSEVMQGTNHNAIINLITSSPRFARQPAYQDVVIWELINKLKPPPEIAQTSPEGRQAFADATQLLTTAINALIAIGPPVAPALKTAWEESNATTRLHIDQAAAFIPSPELADIQTSILENKIHKPEVRAAALRSLAQRKDPERIQDFIQLSRSTTPELRSAALDALRESGEAAVPALLRQLPKADTARQRDILNLLADIGGDSARQALFNEVQNNSIRELQLLSIRLLAQEKPVDLLPILIERLHSPSPREYGEARSTLLEYGPIALPALVESLGSGTPENELRKQSLLQSITGQRFGADRAAWDAFLSNLDPAVEGI